jgi:predicted RNA-binding Zn-ribbon protein involved in translation (DUF1610 family)
LMKKGKGVTRFQCPDCGWESRWMPTRQAVEPHHECKVPKQIKPVFS